MSEEQIKFRPNIPEALRQGDREIFDEAQERIKSGAVKGSVDHDIEFFLIKTRLKNGQEVEQRIPRNSGGIPLDKKDKDQVASPGEAVEAVQRFFPELERPSVIEAIKRLRASKEKG